MKELSFEWQGSDILVSVSTQAQVELVDAVVDLDEFGEVIGIEILGLLSKYPNLGSATGKNETLPWMSIDSAADAISIRLKNARSLDQEVRLAAVAFDAKGRLAALRIRFER